MPQPRTRRPNASDDRPAAWPELSKTPPDQLIVEHLNSDLIVIDNVIQPKELKQWRLFVDKLAMDPPQPPLAGHADRRNFRAQFHDKDFAQKLWTQTGLDELCARLVPSRVKGKRAIGLNQNIRVYKYPEGSFFGPHYDDDVYDAQTKQRSEWTLLIYLTGQSDGVVGTRLLVAKSLPTF
ncbi:hypothetical protein OIV83_000413 [Microbotryomycetes sp. JL201]|nr:hypothetical protein OIV83_000413 [Microbotryomycetes sp. JL201]